MDKVCTTREINHVRDETLAFSVLPLQHFIIFLIVWRIYAVQLIESRFAFFFPHLFTNLIYGYWWVFYDLQEFKNTPNYREYEGKMPTERCAKLMVVGMANNLDELWISNNPMLLMTYANQYFPTVFKWYEFSVRTYLFLHALESLIRNFRFQISSVLTFWEVFSCTLLTNIDMISLAIWCNKHM